MAALELAALEAIRADASKHEVAVIESGSFARATCRTCGWSGPARRARAVAIDDIAEHHVLGGAQEVDAVGSVAGVSEGPVDVEVGDGVGSGI